jgi:hypothetical protein
VFDLNDLTRVIIPHFKAYPLLTQKGADFMLFEQIVELMSSGVHLTDDGLQQIVNIKSSMNLGVSNVIKSKFPLTVPVERLIIQTANIPDPQWISGFVSGEGNFYCGIRESQNQLSNKVSLKFTISQHARDIQLLKLIMNYFSSGRLDVVPNITVVNLVMERFSDLNDQIIPFFNNYPILTLKNLDYLDWCRIAKLRSERVHLTFEGLEEIKKIKSGMN